MAKFNSEKEYLAFWDKVADYIGKHPEFIDELQERISKEETSEKKETNYSDNGKAQKKGFLNFDEEKINTISSELSSLLFDKDKSEKSFLEKTIQDAFSGMVKNYLSKYI